MNTITDDNTALELDILSLGTYLVGWEAYDACTDPEVRLITVAWAMYDFCKGHTYPVTLAKAVATAREIIEEGAKGA